MAYNVNTFLKPLSTSDKLIQVVDPTGVVKFTINPFTVKNTFVRGNVIYISLNSDREVLLDFRNQVESRQAIILLESQLETLRNKTPNYIDRIIEEYIVGLTSFGTQGPQGPQGDQGYQGPQGFQGNQGFQGHQGFQGPQGDQGFQGVTGATGATGPQGIPGIPARQPKFSVYLKNNETLTADPFSATGINFTNNIITIPANTISPNDNIVIKLYLEKTITTSGSNVFRMSIGTSPNQNDRQNPAVAANLVNINIPTSVGQFWMTRYNIRSTSNNFSGLSGGYSDVGVNSNSNTILGFDFANTLYLIPYIQYGSATFIVREMQLEIW